jgi:hypothetical protein
LPGGSVMQLQEKCETLLTRLRKLAQFRFQRGTELE